MAGGSITGVVGQIKWAYYVAADIHGYTITRSEARWSLSGFVGVSDAFKLSQRPLTFVAPTAKGDWRWPIETIEIADGRLIASLGPPEE